MKNKKLCKIEKLIRMVNEKYSIPKKEIRDIRVEDFENEAIIELRESEDQEFKIYTITKKEFEAKYRIAW